MSNLTPENPEEEILPEDYQIYDISFKIIVIGNQGVGKSCLSIQATKNIFQNNYLATIGFEFYTFNCKIHNKVIKLQIWDTCGQEAYRSLISNFYKSSSLAMVVYAINDNKSFIDIETWVKNLRENSSPDIKIILIGNKCDLDERVISKEDGEKLKNDYDFDYFIETSAKTGFNAKKLFLHAAKILLEEYEKYNFEEKPKDNRHLKLDKKDKDNDNKRHCC